MSLYFTNSPYNALTLFEVTTVGCHRGVLSLQNVSTINLRLFGQPRPITHPSVHPDESRFSEVHPGEFGNVLIVQSLRI